MPAQEDGSVLSTGTIVAIADPSESPITYTTITGIRDIGAAGYDRPLVRATDLSDSIEKYHLGRADGTQFNLEMRYIGGDDGQALLRSANTNNTVMSLRITYPNSATRTFSVIVMSIAEGVPDNEHLTVTATCKVTSTITAVDPT